MNIVTVYTDASFGRKHNVAGWSFWVKTDSFTYKRSGVFEGLKEPTQAEFRCIANALYWVAECSGFEPHRTMVVVVTDSLSFINGITKGWLNKEHLKQDAKYIKGQLGRFRRWRLHHVKAHKGTDTPRKYVNSVCDRMAKKRLREFRKRLNGQKLTEAQIKMLVEKFNKSL